MENGNELFAERGAHSAADLEPLVIAEATSATVTTRNSKFRVALFAMTTMFAAVLATRYLEYPSVRYTLAQISSKSSSKVAVVPATGCSNWQSILLRSSTATDEHHCIELCKKQAGCTSMNYQPAACAGDQQEGARHCNLYTGECITGTNVCFNWAEIPVDQRAQTSSESSSTAGVVPATGCTNWQKIVLRSTTASDESHCIELCKKEFGCTSMNYQPAECEGLEGAHRCHLYTRECIKGTNTCFNWAEVPLDQRAQISSESSSTAAVVPATGSMLAQGQQGDEVYVGPGS